jgi:hypothetical protein
MHYTPWMFCMNIRICSVCSIYDSKCTLYDYLCMIGFVAFQCILLTPYLCNFILANETCLCTKILALRT